MARQVEHATAYALRKGWTPAPEFVYVDDGVSGAEFATRPGFLRLMNALKPRPPFQVLVMSEEARLGRESIETAYALKQLVQAGVKVWFYLEDRERTLDSPTDKIMMSLTAFADELEREKARQRTYDAMSRKARAGHVTGGRVFGYDNVVVMAPNGMRSHVERHINAAEADVVRRIFQRCAEGRGMRAIAVQLNEEGAVCPRAQQGRPTAWAPTSVRDVLHRPLYHGEVVWNKTRKRDRWGLKKSHDNPETDWVRVVVPALQIVPDDVWVAAQARLEATRASYLRGTDGRLWGRPLTGVESKYLLPGLAKCAMCGGGVIVRSRSHGRKRAQFYACSSYHQRGRAVCTNNLEVPVADVDRVVIRAFEQQVLRPDLAERALTLALSQLAPTFQSAEQDMATLTSGIGRLDAEIARLTGAIADGGDVPSLVAGVKERETQRGDLRRRLTAARRTATDGHQEELPELLRAKLSDWTGVLHRQIPQARQALKKMLQGSLLFAPKDDGQQRYYEITGTGTLERILASVTNPIMMASPTGFEPVF